MIQRIQNFKQRNVFAFKSSAQRTLLILKSFRLSIPVMYYISSPHPITHLQFLTYTPLESLSANKLAYCEELSNLYEFHHNFWLQHLNYIEKVEIPKDSMISKEHYIVSSATHLHIYYKEFWAKMIKLTWLRIKALF